MGMAMPQERCVAVAVAPGPATEQRARAAIGALGRGLSVALAAADVDADAGADAERAQWRVGPFASGREQLAAACLLHWRLAAEGAEPPAVSVRCDSRSAWCWGRG